MRLVLNSSDFVHNRYTVSFGDNMEAVFIMIADEEFPGANSIAKVNVINILVRQRNDSNYSNATLQSPVIGLGNNIVGVMSSNPELRGKVLNKDNMSECVVLLYEDGAA